MSRESADALAALRVNAAFYSAMAEGDLAAMDALWSRDEPVLCIHPGGPPLQGRVEVMASFRGLFDGGPPPIEFSRDAVSLVRGLAFVSCIEHLAEASLAASNILVWESGEWRFVQHVASAIAPGVAMASPERGALH